MLRIAAVFMLLTLTGSALAQAQTERAALKPHATVSTNLVRIGDLVEHAGAAADAAIFRSPDLGHTGVVAVASVLEALRPHGLTDVDTRGLTDIVVTRTSRVVSVKEIETNIIRALAGRRGLGAPADLTLKIDQTLRTIHLEPQAAGALEVVRLAYDARQHRFDIVFDIAGSAILKRTPLHLSGSVVETAEVVTAVRAVRRGEILNSSDVAIERRPRKTIASDAVIQIEAVVGLAARRALRTGEPLRGVDLMRPELVQRNDNVLLVFEAPGMLLTMRGKALDVGADGNVISVLNLQSKRTVHGTVIGPGRVRVSAPMTRLASAALSPGKPIPVNGAQPLSPE